MHRQRTGRQTLQEMKMKTTLATIFALSLALAPATLAHHSQSEYDSRKKVEVEGTVSKVEWKSPHAWIHVDVTNDKVRR